MKYDKEEEMYPIIKDYYQKRLTSMGYEVTIYDTHNTLHSDLKSKFNNEWRLLGNRYKPDFIIKYFKDNTEKYIVIEVKKDSPTIKDIAQVKLYGDILKPEILLLISGNEIERGWIRYHLDSNDNFFSYDRKNVKTLFFIKMDKKGIYESMAQPWGISYA